MPKAIDPTPKWRRACREHRRAASQISAPLWFLAHSSFEPQPLGQSIVKGEAGALGFERQLMPQNLEKAKQFASAKLSDAAGLKPGNGGLSQATELAKLLLSEAAIPTQLSDCLP
nr:hypothetical protein [Aquabacterium sp. CECT 9606]